MKTYRVHFGKSPEHFHSYRDFSKLSDALAYLWALANVPKFERLWYWQRLDGWLRNDHMRGKPYPKNLANQIESFIEEEKGIHTMEAKTNYEKAVEIYEVGGQYAVYDAVKKGELIAEGWSRCTPCETDTPYEDGVCLVCGSKHEKAGALTSQKSESRI